MQYPLFHFRWLAVLLLAIAVGRTAWGQTPPAYLKFRHYTAREGLPGNQISDLIQDRRGFLWLANEAGLHRFDGVQFRSFRPGNATGLLDDDFLRFARTPEGRLWVLSRSGLAWFDETHQRFRYAWHPVDGQEMQENFHLLADSARHCLWLATSAGLLRYDLRTNRAQPTALRAIYRPFECVRTAGGDLVVAASEGAFVYEPERDTFRFIEVDKSEDEHFISAYADADGRVWLGRNFNGLLELDPATGRHVHHFPPGFAYERNSLTIHDIATVPQLTGPEVLWLATDFHGIFLFDCRQRKYVGQFRHDPHQLQGLLSDRVARLYPTPEGTVWVADQTLSRLDPRQQQFVVEQTEGLPPVAVSAMVSDPSDPNRLWIAPRGHGLVEYDRRRRRPVRWFFRGNPPKAPGQVARLIGAEEHVWNLHFDTLCTLWAATHTGLTAFGPGKGTRRDYPVWWQNQRQRILFITRDRRGRVWFIAEERVGWLDPVSGQSRVLELPSWPGQKGFPIANHLLAEGDTLWVGTHVGLFRLDARTGRVTGRYLDRAVARPMAQNDIHWFIRSRNGALWLACYREGLRRFDPTTGRFSRWQSPDDGSALARPYWVREDARGFLWAMTDNAIWRVQVRGDELRTENFSSEAPVQHDHHVSRPRPEAQGTLWFAYTAQALFFFNPDRVSDQIALHKPLLTAFRLFDQPQPFHPDSTALRAFPVRHDQNVLSFEFTALDFSQAEKITFEYRLDGFDEAWVKAGTRRSATYTNLDGGHYTFRVRALNALGQVGPEEARFRLFVQTPYWRAWWFYALLALAFAGLVFGGFRYRYLEQLRLLRLRANLARDLHDDVGSYLGSISILSQSAENRNPERTEATMQKMGETARKAMDLMGDIVWSINPEHDGLAQVVERLRDFAGELFENSHTRLRFEADADVLALKLPLENRRDFFLIGKEALVNAARYANASEIRLTLTRPNGLLCLTVHDDGVGFDPASPPRSLGGNGLKNMATRAHNLGGTLSIAAAPGQGTTISLEFPLH